MNTPEEPQQNHADTTNTTQTHTIGGLDKDGYFATSSEQISTHNELTGQKIPAWSITLAFIGLFLIDKMESNPASSLNLLPFLISSWIPYIFQSYKSRRINKRLNEMQSGQSFEGMRVPVYADPTLGLEIVAFHDGETDSSSQDEEMNACVVNLAPFNFDNILISQTAERDAVIEDFNTLRFQAIRNSLQANTNLKNVYITRKKEDLSRASTSLNQALRKYDLVNRSTDTAYEIFTREELLDLTRDPESIVKDALEALADPELTSLYTLLCDPSCPNPDSVVKSIQTRIHRLLDTEVAKNFQASYLAQGAFDADSPNQRYTHRQRLSPFTQLRRTDNGFYFVEIDTHVGSTSSQPLAHAINIEDPENPHPHPQHIPLEQLISVSDQPIDDILASRSIYQRAQLLYVLDYILRSTSIEDLMKPLPTIEDVQERMQSLGVEITDRRLEDLINGTRAKKNMRVISGIVKNGILGGMLFPFIQFGSNIHDTIEQREELAKPIGEVQVSSSALTSERPPSTPVWKISSTIDTRGIYWIQQTSTRFIAGEQSWIFGTSILNSSEPQSYPPLSEAHPDEQYLTIEQGTKNLLTFKYSHIPSPQNMKISHASLILEDNTHIPAQIRRDESGGYLLLMSDQDLDHAPYAVRLAIRFIPDSDRTTRAQSDGFELSEEEHQQLDASTQGIINQARELFNERRFLSFDDALAAVILSRYQYGYDPAETKQLSEQSTSVGFLNTAAKAKMMQCNTANTLFTMLAEEPRVYATGYINPKITVEKEGYQEGFLTADGMHAFSLDSRGEILDATPTRLNPNKVVEEDNSKLGEEFEASIPKAPMKGIDELEDNLVALLPFAAIATTLFGAMQLSRYMKKHITPDKRREIEAQMIESTSSQENIQIATQFLLHISWSNVRNNFIPKPQYAQDAPVQFLIDNVNYAVIEKYIERPEDFENESLTRSQKNTCRTIAYFLYHRH